MLMDEGELRERVSRIETLLEEIEALEDPRARARTAEMVQTLLELYGEGLGRIVEAVGRWGGQDLKDELLEDELISHHLLLHEGHWILERLPDGRYLMRHPETGRTLGPEPPRPGHNRPPPEPAPPQQRE